MYILVSSTIQTKVTSNESMSLMATNDLQPNLLSMPDEILGTICTLLLPKEGGEHRLWEEFGTYLFNLILSTRFRTDAPWKMLYNHLFCKSESRKVEHFPYGVFNEPGDNHKEWFVKLIMDYDKERKEYIKMIRESNWMFHNLNEENPIIGWKNDDIAIAKEIVSKAQWYYIYLSQRVKDTKSVVVAAVKSNIHILKYAKKWQVDKDIVLAAYGEVFTYQQIPENLRTDRDIVHVVLERARTTCKGCTLEVLNAELSKAKPFFYYRPLYP